MVEKREFYKWIREQQYRDDAVGWFGRWCKRIFLKTESFEPFADKINAWLSFIKDHAKKNKAMVSSVFLTAWKEFESEELVVDSTEPESSDVMVVRSTIANLNKVIKGNHESGEFEKEEEISVTKFKGPTATVGVRQRITISHRSDWFQLGVMLSVPCYPEEIEKAFEFADKWVTERIRREEQGIRGNGVPEKLEEEYEEVQKSDTVIGQVEGDGKGDEKVETEIEESSDFKLESPGESEDFGI